MGHGTTPSGWWSPSPGYYEKDPFRIAKYRGQFAVYDDRQKGAANAQGAVAIFKRAKDAFKFAEEAA